MGQCHQAGLRGRQPPLVPPPTGEVPPDGGGGGQEPLTSIIKLFYGSVSADNFYYSTNI